MDEATEETTETTEVQPEPEAKGLRAQNDQLRKEVRELKATKANDTIAGLGLTLDTGIGLVLSEQFSKGDLALGDITEAATKYGHVVPEAQPAAHPEAEAIAQGQAALDQIGQTAGSVAPPTESDALAKAEAEGDYATTMAIKGQQVADSLRR